MRTVTLVVFVPMLVFIAMWAPWYLVALLVVVAVNGLLSFRSLIRHAEAHGPAAAPPSLRVRRRARLLALTMLAWSALAVAAGVVAGWIALAAVMLAPLVAARVVERLRR